MVIDSHHHFWHYNQAEYGWIPDAWAPLRRNYLPADLHAELKTAGVDGVVTVQARQSLEETRWLLDLAAQHAFIRGVVGWAPLVDASLPQVIEELRAHPAARKLRSFRHVLQAEADDAYMLREDFNRGLRHLTRLGYVYDILILEKHLPNTLRFVDLHPDQTFIVDHIAKPRIAAGELEPWARNLRELAKRAHVSCKLSGMVTEDDVSRWSPERLRPYFDVVIEAFGPSRLLFGTDWPVCLAGVSYQGWKQTVEHALARLTKAEQADIMGGNALRLYGLPTLENSQSKPD
jgi:L-fuconolactonase